MQRPSLHRQDVVLDHFEDGQILVDHSVQDRVQHIVDTLAELHRRCLELLPKFAQRSGIAVHKAAGLEDRGQDMQDMQEAVDHGLHSVDMVRDVVEIWCHFGADAGKVAANELSHQLGHSPERALEPREFGP